MAAQSIPYYPSAEAESKFWQSQDNLDERSPQVPDGFPTQLDSPLAWSKRSVEAQEHKWVLNLSNDDVQDIEDALKKFEGVSSNPSDVSKDTFPLPAALVSKLRQVSDQCYHGIGFQIIHGLNPLMYTELQNVIIFAALAFYIAPHRGFVNRDRKKVLGHSVNANDDDYVKAPAFTNRPVAFHSDAAEILTLYALDLAPEGGRLMLASAWQLYNDLAIWQPDVLKTLSEDWLLDTFQDYEKHPPLTTPLLHKARDNQIHVRFSRYPMTGVTNRPRNTSLPPPTPAQIKAMDAVQFRAAQNAIALPMERGDIVFINDTALLHARESFEERGLKLKRHLLKMYLHDPEQHSPVPASIQPYWDQLYGPNWFDGTRRETWDIFHRPGLPTGGFSNG